MRSIDADNFERTINSFIGIELSKININNSLTKISDAQSKIEILKNILHCLKLEPTVDPIEVHCNNCEWCSYNEKTDTYTCNNEDGLYSDVSSDGYCYRGV